MNDIDFDLPADVFWSKSQRRTLAKGSLVHARFDTLAEAICHVMQDDGTPRFSLSIDTDDATFDRAEVEAIFASDPFAAFREADRGAAGK